MDSIHTLEKKFSEFPGIGPRQAQRFVYFLLRKDRAYLTGLLTDIEALKKSVTSCSSCFQFFQKKSASQTLCSICADPNRDETETMVVSHDVDLERIEKSGVYHGQYFVLGGIIPILTPKPEEKIRSHELHSTISARAKKGLKEIILAMNATPDGDSTGEYVEKILGQITKAHTIKISHLGRGISTGTEIEYSDKETIKNALENRK